MRNLKFDFLISSLHKGSVQSTTDVLSWIKRKNQDTHFNIDEIPLESLKQWNFLNQKKIAHNSGKFFSIEGIKVKTNWGIITQWEQPIINQPEIGFLGIIVKKIDNVYHFLMQAKIEPGNLNIVQLSPTLQATRSNYTKVHQGTTPKYLEYFNGQKDVTVLLDQLQSEQGARFLRKRNRNIIVAVAENENIENDGNFVWVTLRQIKELMCYDNVVNMDTRTVISAISYGAYSKENLKLLEAISVLFKDEVTKESSSLLYSVLSVENSLYTINEILSWITERKFMCELEVESVDLLSIKDWVYDGNRIHHKDEKYFSVIGLNVNIGNREVISWDQPMIKPHQEGLLAFLIKKINGVYHFLVQAKVEAGNFDLVELAPTVQCLTGNYRTGKNEYSIPFINDVLSTSNDNVWYKSMQSEEGGRFFKEQNLNIIVEVDEKFPIKVPVNYCWMTLNQLISFASYNNYLNIGARSLLSAIRFTKLDLSNEIVY
jgi:oxidase EvaA